MSLVFRSGLLQFIGRNSLFAAEVFTKARIYFLCSKNKGVPPKRGGPASQGGISRFYRRLNIKKPAPGGVKRPGDPAALSGFIKEFSGKKRKSEIFIERLKDPGLKASCNKFLFKLESSLNSVEAAVRDFRLPGVEGDEFISEMAFALQTGAKEIYNAASRLKARARRSNSVLKAKRACNSAERAYRRAITASREREGSVSSLKTECVYKGLSDAGDSLDAAADAAAEILCK